jgi:Family of unknown function (DUF6526)
MTIQTYANHRRTDPAFHIVLVLLLVLLLGGSITNLVLSWGDHQRIYSAALLVVLSLALWLVAFLFRIYALKAQDRAIRAEENLRHFVLTGKLLDPRLTIRQTVALRFAPDGEFVPLAEKAAQQSLAPDAIKRSIQNWRADLYRV